MPFTPSPGSLPALAFKIRGHAVVVGFHFSWVKRGVELLGPGCEFYFYSHLHSPPGLCFFLASPVTRDSRCSKPSQGVVLIVFLILPILGPVCFHGVVSVSGICLSPPGLA